MKKAFLSILALTAAILAGWGIWKTYHDSRVTEEREKFRDAREQFVKMEEQYAPDELADLDYFRSAEVSAENILKPKKYVENGLMWVEKAAVTVSVENSFDALTEQQKYDYIEHMRAVSVNAMEKIQKDKVPAYAAYRTYRENAFPGYEGKTVSYAGFQSFYVKTDIHTYKYTDFNLRLPGISRYEEFYIMDGDLVEVENEDDDGSGYGGGGDLTDASGNPEHRSSGASERSSGHPESASGHAAGAADEPDTYEDEYNVNDYDDPDDFYEDNADDFEDEEDAEDYYDEYHE